MSTVIEAGNKINHKMRPQLERGDPKMDLKDASFMDGPKKCYCSEEDGGVKNVNGDCGRQGNKSCEFNKPRQG